MYWMFLSPKLFGSLEILFSGLIINYSKLFISNKNQIKININKVIKNEELIKFHESIIELRHKHYAHNEQLYSKVCLKYCIENENIVFDESKENIKMEFYQNFDFKKFLLLLENIEKY
jgi:hypothetical protein